MPTDDDYGRRERLLLHQSAAGQYGQPSSPLRGGSSTANPTNSSANGKTSTASSNTSSSSSAHEHPYGRQQPISQSLGYSSRYDSDQARQSYQQLSSVCDRSHSSKKANSSVGNSGEYANSSVLIAAATAGGSVANPFAGAETFLHSPPSPAPAGSDRFVPPPPLSPSVSDKYSSSQSLANYHPTDRLLSSGGASAARDQQQQHQQQQQSKEQRSFSSTDRLLAAVSAASAASDAAKEQQRYSASSTERLLASASPVLGVLSERCGYGGVSKDGSVSSSGSSSSSIRYGISSTERLLTSSPIHAPVPEKFANSSTSSSATNGGKSSGGYFKDSPLHERYHHGSQQTSSQHYNSCSSSAAAAERYSPNPEGARYSSSERILGGSSNAGAEQQISRRYSTDQALESACQKYADSRASPGPTEFTNRYQGYQESSGTSGSGQRYGGTSDRFNDLALQRYAQNRPSDRYSAGNERYLSSNTSSAHDSRQTGTCELNRYSSSSTERLLASSSSPSLTESRDGHNQTFSSGSSIGAQSGEVSQSRYSTLSPTPDGVANPSGGHHSLNCHLQQSSSKQSSSDKYHHHHHQHQSQSQSQSQQQHLSSGKQSYGSERVGSYDHLCSDQFIERVGDRYGLDRFSGADSRFPSSGSDRYHCTTTERYSPARGNADKYLSLPKSKDRYSGRVANSCASISSRASDSGYGNGGSSYVPPTAHTPVERYVPQPPPEVLYPDRYVDRYVPPGAHTPADRYVPVSEPSDSFLRRGNDLSYHHSYRAAAPSGYPYQSTTTTTTTTHYRYRGLNATAYQSPGRIGGSPSSSSSSSSTSVQRDGFSTSPLLRSKVHDFNNGSSGSSSRGSGQSSQQTQSHQQPACCAEVATPSQRTSACCQSARRSMPPGALPSIPQQTGLSSWQQSPNSATTNTSTLSSTDNDNSGGSGQSISLYPVNQQQSPQPQLSQQGSTESSSTSTPTTSSNSAATMATCASGSNASTASAGAAAPAPTSAPNITRSVSAPTGQQPRVQIQASTSTTPSSGTRPKLRRNQSRTEVIKNYIKQETATFFGVNEETEATEKQKWLDRRRRMASRKYGTLLPEYRPPDPDITKDVPDALDAADPVTLRKWQRPVRRKDSVARMTLSGIQYMVDTLRRQKGSERAESSRSFPPSAVHAAEDAQTDDGGVTTDAALDDDEEEAFFQAPAKVAPPPSGQENLQAQQLVDEASLDDVNVTQDALRNVSVVDGAEPLTRIWSPSAMPEHKPEDRAIVDGHSRGHRSRNVPTKDHYTLRSRPEMYQHHQQQHHQRPLSDVQVSMHAEDPRRQKARFGGKRIAPSTIDRVFDNSNRRQYGMGIVGRFFGRSFRKSVASKPDVRKQLDDIEDHRPYFTYWITTVQVLILIFSIACYGFGPVGFDLAHRSSLVLVTSLSLQQVEYQEPANFWIGPRASDLIHLGAKFAPCMRRDIKILKEIDVWREKERDTACCIRNDDSGCVQSSRAECSVRGMSSTSTNTISTWKKWGPADSGPGGRISGSVCGLDPKFCDAPASIAPYEWPDDITKWPICRKINPLSQRFRAKDAHLHGNANFPVGRYKDKMAEHMICEVIGHPCCIGIHGSCRITTKEYCDFVHGYFHEEASLCSQVECLHDVCGMIPFLNPEWPDQFYRLFTTMFLHAGILHIAITLVVQYFLMRDLEKLTGSIRIMLIYFIGALAGNLASAIFVPYRAEVGPAGAHFALLATLVVEVLHCWPMLKYPRRALSKLIFILIGLLCLGVLPWIDNYAHLFGFIFGFLAAYALMPFISFGHYDRRRKIVVIWICTVLIVGLFTLLLALFYSVPMYECEICKLFNCIPLTRDFCASQNINFKKEEPV